MMEELNKWRISCSWIRRWKPKTPEIPNASEDVKQQKLSFIVGGNAKCYSYFGQQFGNFLQNLKYPSLCNVAVILFDIHLNEVKTYVHTKTFTWMFIVALFIIVKP
jgi:hypothetical protein